MISNTKFLLTLLICSVGYVIIGVILFILSQLALQILLK